jgi:formate hydrogenlyase subunit 3/multisubunit Na+/H+ antiporter MnhD subunit
MKPNRASDRLPEFQKWLLILTVSPLLLALIGLGVGWFTLGPRIFIGLQAIADVLLLILAFFAVGGLIMGAEEKRRLAPLFKYAESFSQKTSLRAERRRLFTAIISFIVVSVLCAFVPYLANQSERTLFNMAAMLVIAGLGFSTMFAVSFILLSVVSARENNTG